MRRKEYNELFDALDMPPRGIVPAELLGICRRSTFLHSGGDRPPSVTAAKLLRLIAWCKRQGYPLDQIIEAMEPPGRTQKA